MKESMGCKGEIRAEINFRDGRIETVEFNNAILKKGREALAKSLANVLESDYEFFVSRMIFGDGGVATNGTPRTVFPEMNALFGTQRVSKPVVANLDPNNNSQVIFTSVVTYDEGNDFTLNEMALRMNNGDLYSMATFPGITKTSQMQITWTWRLSFI